MEETSTIQVNLPAEPVVDLGFFTLNQSMMGSLLISAIMIILALIIRRSLSMKPSKLQLTVEMLLGYILDKLEVAFGDRKTAKKFIPLIFTIFLFLLLANQFALIPLIESITWNDGVIFRTPTTDYSLPIALTLIVVVLSHILALSISPIRHLGNFIKIKPLLQVRKLKDLPMALLDLFFGLLDIIGEVAKLVSLATRLFGNMFAGFVIVIVISSLHAFTAYLAPVPFLVLGTLSGVVQAFVFAMLSIIYISSSVNAVKTTYQNS